MSFIAKNPISAVEITSLPPVPIKGTRGIFAKKDGWYDIDSSDNINKIATIKDINELLADKVDEEEGKGLSTNDFTDEYKKQLDDGININVDTELSETSENPVQNKVIKKYIDENTAIKVDANNNTVGGDQESNKINENGALNTVEGKENFIGISRLPSVQGTVYNTKTINAEDYSGYLSLTKVRFGDFVYYNSLSEKNGLYTYTLEQAPINSITDNSGNIYYNDENFDYSSVQSITFGESTIIYDTQFTDAEKYDYIISAGESFTFSNETIVTTFNSTIFTGEINGVESSHVEGSYNTVLSNNVHVEGKNNIGGMRAYRIEKSLPGQNAYKLDCVDGLVKGDVYSIKINTNYNNWGKIVSIDENTNTVVVDTFISDPLYDDETIKNYPLENTFRIIAKPFLGTIDFAPNAHVEGSSNRVFADEGHAEGIGNTVYGRYGHAEGNGNIAGYNAHAEGRLNIANGNNSHVEGNMSTVNGANAHGEGRNHIVNGDNAHAEGYGHIVNGNNAHAEGYKNTVKSNGGHVEGTSNVVNGNYAHAEGFNTIASGKYQHVEGMYNIEDKKHSYIHIAGNGTSNDNRSNAYTLDWNGNAWFASDITAGGDITANGNIITNGDITANNIKLPSLIKELTIQGKTIVDTDSKSSSTSILQNISIDGNSIINLASKNIELASTNKYSDKLVIIDGKVKLIKNVRKITIDKTYASKWVQATKKDSDGNTVLDKRFYININNAVSSTGEKLLNSREEAVFNNNDIVFFTDDGLSSHFTTYSANINADGKFGLSQSTTEGKEYIRLSIFDSNAIDIRTSATGSYIPLETNKNNIPDGSGMYDFREFSMDFYFCYYTTPDPEYIDVDYSTEWNDFINSYNYDSNVSANAIIDSVENTLNVDITLGTLSETITELKNKGYAVDDSMSNTSENPVQNKVITQYLNNLTDQKYTPTSTKPQSGRAVAEAMADLLGTAPENLDTLEELAKALNEDENFAAKVIAELTNKADKVDGKGLSTNDFTTALKNKLDGIEPNATALPKVINIYCENQLDERVEKWQNKSLFNEYTDDGLYYFSLKYNNYGDINDEYTYFAQEAQDALLLVSVGENGGNFVNQTLIIDGRIYTTTIWSKDYIPEWLEIYDFTHKANKENAFDYYVEINQDKYFEYDNYTKIGTYLLCRKTDEDYHGNPPWQYYKLLTVVDGDPDYLVQTEYDLSHGGCRTRNNFNEETCTAGDWNPWVNVFVSQWDLTDAIGDVETSLENIIAKYGLGGDSI